MLNEGEQSLAMMSPALAGGSAAFFGLSGSLLADAYAGLFTGILGRHLVRRIILSESLVVGGRTAERRVICLMDKSARGLLCAPALKGVGLSGYLRMLFAIGPRRLFGGGTPALYGLMGFFLRHTKKIRVDAVKCGGHKRGSFKRSRSLYTTGKKFSGQKSDV